MLGHLILIEGIEGAGKTTLVNRLVDVCQGDDSPLPPIDVVTKEPGGTAFGNKVREMLLNPEQPLDAMTELNLFCADRAQHITETINPVLDAGGTVLCDRFSLSTIAYQGARMPLFLVKSLEHASRTSLIPSRVTQILLDLDPQVGLNRKFGEEWDAIECRPSSYHEEVARLFREQGHSLFPTVTLNANLPQTVLLNQSLQAIQSESIRVVL